MLSRMAGDRTLVLAACATALFATTVLAALTGYVGSVTGYVGSVTGEGLRRTLAAATFESAGTTIGVHVPADGLPGVRDRTRVAPAALAVEGGLLRLSIPATPYQRTYQGDAVPVPRVSVHVMAAGAGPPPGHPSENADLLPAVPGVVTSELARRADAGVGGTVTVSTADGEQPITVVGVAPALPSVPGGTAGALVDLPTLTERRLAVTGADPAALAPSRSR